MARLEVANQLDERAGEEGIELRACESFDFCEGLLNRPGIGVGPAVRQGVKLDRSEGG